MPPILESMEALFFDGDLSSELIQDRLGFEELTHLLRQWTGIILAPSIKSATLMACRLTPLMQRLGIRSYREYGHLLMQAPANSEHREAFVSALSIHTTSFFRQAQQFEVLKQAYLKAKAPFRIWSAACSTGAEPYTMTFVLHPLFAQVGHEYRILASDIAPDVLQKGAQGLYREREWEGLTPALRAQFGRLQPDGRSWQVSSHLRERIVWAKLNLQSEETRRIRDLDVIFCRNVLIYFDRPSVQTVLGRLIESLKPGGLLMLGSSEGALVQQQAQTLGVERLDGAVFRKLEV